MVRFYIEASTQSIDYKNDHIIMCCTYDHRTLKIRLPVRSAIYKQCTGGLVVRWVTTSESPLLYVFAFNFCSPGFFACLFFPFKAACHLATNMSFYLLLSFLA